MTASSGAADRPPRPSRLVLLALPLAGIGIALVVAELALRLLGFRYAPYPVVQFGWPDPKTIVDRYEADPDLLWVTRGYQALLSGARDKRPAVVFMGDSCTEFGTYPRRTLDLLAERRQSLAHGIAVGVGGWSVVQGSRQLQRDILPLRPRVVTIYFGWNDHWVALGPPDAEIRRGRAAAWLSDRIRIVQLVNMLAFGRPANAEPPNRVDPETYQRTLEQMVNAIRDNGGAAVLVTAPSAHLRGQEPEYLRTRHLKRLEDLVPLHQDYIELTRRAARSSSAELCDAAMAFDTLAPPRSQYFIKDGIHLTEAGDAAMADLLHACIQRADATRGFER